VGYKNTSVSSYFYHPTSSSLITHTHLKPITFYLHSFNKMFSKLALFAAASMAIFVAAAPTPDGGIKNSCNTGSVQCCTCNLTLYLESIWRALLGQSLYEEDSNEVTILKALLGVEVPVNALVGVQCSPITVIGAGKGAKWYVFLLHYYILSLRPSMISTSKPVCCNDSKSSE